MQEIQQEPVINLLAGSVRSHMKEIGAKSRDFFQVPVKDIRIIPGFNVREKDSAYMEHVRGLAASMCKEGFYQHKPLAGYVAKEGDQDVVFLTDGHCRFEAISLAAEMGTVIEIVPIVFHSVSANMEDLYVTLAQSNTGKQLTPFELGRVCKKLENCGLEVEEVAERLNLGAAYVTQLLRLQGAPLELRKAVQEGKLSATMANEMLTKFGSEVVAELKKAEESASASGKTRITKASLPGAAFRKVLKKEADSMCSTLRDVKLDPGFASLNEDLRSRLESLLEKLAKAEDDIVNTPEGDVSDNASSGQQDQ